MVKDNAVDYFKRLTLEAKLIKQKYKSLGTGKEGKLDKWSGYIFVMNKALHISISILNDFPSTPPRIKVNSSPVDFNEKLSVLKNWREEYHIIDVIDNLIEYLKSRGGSDKIISKRLAEELQRLSEVSHTLRFGSEYVSIRILRNSPSLKEYKLMIAFSKYSKPKLNGKMIIIKITLPEEFPKEKPIIEISSGGDDINSNLKNYLENLHPLRNWNPDNHLFEVALSILEFFNNYAAEICAICLNRITAQEHEDIVRCRNSRCLSLYHRNCLENWVNRGNKKRCVFCDTQIQI